jgi:phage terminase small subunit
MSGLTPKQEAFCREYLIDFNGTQAAIRAGYAEGSAKVQASRLLTNANVSTYLSQTIGKATEESGVTIQRVVKEFARIAFLDPQELLNSDGSIKAIEDMPEDARRAIGGLEIKETWDNDGEEPVRSTLSKLKMIDKKGALDSLGKYLKMFIERHEHDHKGEIHLYNVADIRPHKKEDA